MKGTEMSETGQKSIDAAKLDDELDAPIPWRSFGIEDYIVFLVFWVLALDIFVQFFTRYVLDNSLGWTEEIARYLLIAVGFIGSILAVRKNSHIMVEFLFRFVPPKFGAALTYCADVGRIGFFAMLSFICFKLAGRTKQMMVSIDFPKSAMYYMVSVCLAAMAIRSVQVLVRHIRQGGSRISLEHAEHALHTHTD
jgi:TRAP-type C4-dicarboxylate transport system permease small subunit